MDGTPYSNAFVIDFAQFEGISELGGNDLYKIATEIKKIREELGRGLKLGRNRIGVNIFDSKDRQEELDLKSERIADAVQRQQI
ncbi:hypothetical protein [Aeromonas veronii]|uniref:hypothetical protein n=1 Tax=Aeromonas veronii TaxID=654 RepID=UPI00406C5569